VLLALLGLGAKSTANCLRSVTWSSLPRCGRR